jgi:non-specific serine/threonine protein kinase
MSEPPDETALRALLDALLGALETLHDAGHIHGEVSPGNILLLPDDRPVLMDLGAVHRAIISERTRHLMAALGPSGVVRSTQPAGEPQGRWTDLRALAAVGQFCISGEFSAPPNGLHDPASPDPWAGTPRGLPERLPSRRYSTALLDVLDAMRAAQANDALHTAAQFRRQLQSRPAHLARVIGPVPRPVPPAITPDVSSVAPEITQADSVASLGRIAPPLARPRRARVAFWGGAILMVLASGAAGWKLGEHMAGDTTPGKVASAAGRDDVAARAAVGLEGERPVVPNDAPPSVSPSHDGTRPPRPEDRLRATSNAAEAPLAARRGVTGAVLAAATGPAGRPAAPQATIAEGSAAKLSPAARASGSPREECGTRTEFALYRCMQSACAQPQWAAHAQCVRLRARDEVE